MAMSIETRVNKGTAISLWTLRVYFVRRRSVGWRSRRMDGNLSDGDHRDHSVWRAQTLSLWMNARQRDRSLSLLPPVWLDWAIYWNLGNFLKPLETINLPKSPTFCGNFCKGVKIYHFSKKSFCGNFNRHLAIFSGHTVCLPLSLSPSRSLSYYRPPMYRQSSSVKSDSRRVTHWWTNEKFFLSPQR